MFYITGDVHGNAFDFLNRCKEHNIKKGDTIIVLGDFGANFYLSHRDDIFKKTVNDVGVTVFAIHGNHEARPNKISSYKKREWNGGIVYYEPEFSNILFAKDGEIYNINGLKTFVCGGAYSVDKYYRAWRACMSFPDLCSSDMFDKITKFAEGNRDFKWTKADKKEVDKVINNIPDWYTGWWKDEQPSTTIKKHCEDVLQQNDWTVDIVLTHTSPEKFEPIEEFLSSINQDMVDNSTEKWLDKIECKLNYKKWYAGHFHTEKKVNDKFQFLFKNVLKFE